MRRLILLIFLFSSFAAFSQNANFKRLDVDTIRIRPIASAPTDTMRLYNIQDTLYWSGKKIIYPAWKKEIAIDDENNWTIPFALTSKTTILYNGQPLKPAQWSGVGLTTLTVNFNTKQYEYLVVTN